MAKVTIFTGVLLQTAAEAAQPQCVEIAGKIAQDAASNVPVESGEWRAGISSGARDDYAVVVSDDPESFYKEYGTSDTPAHMTLTNAARKYGKYSGMTGR